jgi:hypothetical protein
VWVQECTPAGYTNYAAWTGALGYIDPAFGVLDDPEGFSRVTPQTASVWVAGTTQELFFGLCHHTQSMYLCFSEDDSVAGLQSFWGAAIARPAPGTWTHYALVCDRSNDTCYLYMNGNLITTLDITGHRASNVLTTPQTYGMHIDIISSLLNPPDRGVATRTVTNPVLKSNLHTFHYEALTAAEVRQSFAGKTTQNKATTYARYDWRNVRKGSYQARPGWTRWHKHVYQPFAGGPVAGDSSDSYYDTTLYTKDGQGALHPRFCSEIPGGIFFTGTCCDTSMWGVGQGHVELIQAQSHGLDQDPFWET